MRAHPAAYDVYVDLSSLPRDGAALHDGVGRLAADARFVEQAGHITLSIPQLDIDPVTTFGLEVDAVPGEPAARALARGFKSAAAAHRHLAVLLGPVIASGDLLSELALSFDLDPMFGTSQPRFADPSTDRIWPLPGGDHRLQAPSLIARGALLKLPPTSITPELVACCLMLRWELLNAADLPDDVSSAVPVVLQQILARARRQGFRNLVLNRAVVGTPLDYADVYPPPTRRRAHEASADDPLADPSNELASLSRRRVESLLTATMPEPGNRPRLLLDCGGLQVQHNGTTTGILGFLDGFVGQVASWDIHVLSSPAAKEAHGLVARYPQFRHHSDAPDGGYAAAVLLNQPWEIGQVVALHRQAFVTAFVVLDTISWDIHPGQTRLDATWRFIAQHADGLLYISHFTKERFNRRFPVSPGVSQAVTHLSFAQEDHVKSRVPAVPASDSILVFGNGYVHKDVGPTVKLLADAFPFHRITMFGLEQAPSPNVTAIPSGNLPRTALHGLIAGAGVMVFPSFYEGFGLPVVEGLAYGRSVLVRRSALWNEIAAFSRLPGKLIEFEDPASLVEGVGRVLAGLPTTGLPSGTAVPPGTAPAGWTDCVQRMVDLLTERLASPVTDHWWMRESALRILE